jgi:periplasmic divalent cation tolerance protein
MKYAIVMTTTDKRKIAEAIATILIGKKLAACIQVFNVGSTYWWKGKVAKSTEFMLLIKSKASDYRKIEKEIMAEHDYEVPEIIQIPIAQGSKRYLNWIAKATKETK